MFTLRFNYESLFYKGIKICLIIYFRITTMIQICKYSCTFLVGLFFIGSCYAAIPPPVDPEDETGAVISVCVEPFVEFNVFYPRVDFYYFPNDESENDTWDENTIEISSNASWTFNIVANESFLSAPAGGPSSVNISTINLQKFYGINPASSDFSGLPSASSDPGVQLGTNSNPVSTTGTGDDTFDIHYRMYMSDLGFLLAGKYSVGIIYSVSLP